MVHRPAKALFTGLLLSLVFLLPPSAVHGRVITLTVHNLPDPTFTGIETASDRAVMNRFLKLHPNVRLRAGAGLRLPGVQTMDMVPLMQIAGDISPDVIYVNFRFSDTYIQKGFLKPLDKYIAKMDPKDLARRVPPAVKQVAYRLGPDGKMHWYALPTSRLVIALIYRRDLFARAGLDPDKPPRTWEELMEYSKKLTFPDKGNFGMGFGKGDGAGWNFINLVWSRGGDIVKKNKKGDWEPAFNTDEMTDALYFYCLMNCQKWTDSKGKTHRGYSYRDTSPSIYAPDNPFAMYFQYLDDRVQIHQPELIGFAPFPYPEGHGHSATEVNSAMEGIFAGVKDPEVEKAAFDYLSFLDSDEANKIRVKMYIQRGYGKFVNPESLERYGYKDYLKQVDKRWVKIYKEAMKTGKPEPYGKNCAVVYHELSRPIEEAINDKVVLAALDRHDEKAAKVRLRQILHRAQAETAKRMFGQLPANVVRTRTMLTFVFLTLTALAFAMAGVYLFKTFRRDAPAQTPGQKKLFWAYLLLIPGVATVVLWQYYPLLRGTIMAFQDYNVMGDSPFTGVDNFSYVLFDPAFWHSVFVTLIYTAFYMAFAFVSPIVLALLLSEVPRGKMLFRTIFYVPAVLSGLVVVFLWKSFYKEAGFLNVIINGAFEHVLNPALTFIMGLVHLHFAPVSITQSWLDSPALAMAAVLLPVIWAGMGPGCLIYLAAFKTIPDELYEAAEVDGAGIRRKVFCITLPSIRMLILINVVGAFVGAFMSSETIFVMTGGGPYTPYGSTEVVGLQLFYTAFMYLKFGTANAMAWVLGFMLIGFTMMQLRNLSRVEFKGGR
ncbi:MAG: extracellular solute-binding protein [Armatimonadota bacterium]|nr:extracellular solute-binding protein [Armatimonadota bacterium]